MRFDERARAANRPARATPRRSSRRPLAVLKQRAPIPLPRRESGKEKKNSPSLEQLIEKPLPFALLVGAHQHGDDFLLRQHGDDARRVRLHVLPRRQSSKFGEELLAFAAEHEIAREASRALMRRPLRPT